MTRCFEKYHEVIRKTAISSFFSKILGLSSMKKASMEFFKTTFYITLVDSLLGDLVLASLMLSLKIFLFSEIFISSENFFETLQAIT